MNISSDDESSDSETEYIRPNDKINLNSPFFAKTTKRKFEEASNVVSDSEDEEIPSYTNTELLSQILKNLEETNKSLPNQSQNDSQSSQDSGIDVKNNIPSDQNNDSIRNLLLQGEQNLNASSFSESSFIHTTNQESGKPINQNSIEIVCPFTNDLLKNRKKKKQDLQELLRNRLNKRLRAHQLLIHKVGILCWLSHGFHLNRLINDTEILAVALSLITSANYPKKKVDQNYLQKFTVWFKKNFQSNPNIIRDMNKSALLKALETKSFKNETELVLLYIAILRALGVNCRLVISLCPPERILKKEKLLSSSNSVEKQEVKITKEKKEKITKISKTKEKDEVSKSSFIPENSSEGLARKRIEAKQKASMILGKINAAKTIMDETNKKSKIVASEKQLPKTKKNSNIIKKENIDLIESDSESDEDFMVKSHRSSTSVKKKLPKKCKSENRKLLSSDEEEECENKDKMKIGNYWAEIYIDNDTNWICADVLTGKINNPDDIYKSAHKPILYIIAWNSDGLIKDVTRRYCPRWLTVTRKQRICENWWNDTIKPFKEKKTVASKAEDEILLKRELELPLPKTISECKGHPLYAITRHLLKYEALYPPDIIPLGYLPNSEAIYPRFCVHTLMSRQTWLKHARIVKPAQEPYKIVKSMPKYDKMTGTVCKDQNLELFGKWQTDHYIPPTAKDGIVPRNEFGNVDLFKKSMLPKGTVHIALPGLVRVARKLNIDCAPAVVGFNFGCRGATPATEGYVVCSEFEDILRDAWKTEQVEANKRAKVKREKTVYGNWKKIIKGLLIRKRLAYKYEFNENKLTNSKEESANQSSTSEVSPPKKRKV